jgi:hypothetical protein
MTRRIEVTLPRNGEAVQTGRLAEGRGGGGMRGGGMGRWGDGEMGDEDELRKKILGLVV